MSPKYGALIAAFAVFGIASVCAGLSSDAGQPGLCFALVMIAIVALFAAITLGDAA